MSEDDEWEVIMSPLCQSFELDGKSVQIDIYNGDNGGWIVEIIDEFDNPTIWCNELPTEQEALDDAIRTIKADGILTFIGDKLSLIHI